MRSRSTYGGSKALKLISNLAALIPKDDFVLEIAHLTASILNTCAAQGTPAYSCGHLSLFGIRSRFALYCQKLQFDAQQFGQENLSDVC